MLVAELQRMVRRQLEIVLPCVLPVVRVETVVVDAIRFLDTAIVALGHGEVGSPPIRELAVREYGCLAYFAVKVVEIGRHSVGIIETRIPVRLKKTYARIPLVAEPMTHRRRY